MERKAQQTVRVATFTRGLVGPSIPMVGPVADGGTIVAETAPGCWGPMITPSFRGGHEVTTPVAVEGAEPGDAVVIRIQKIRVTSTATASGTMSFVEGRYTGDPFVARHCPECGTENPPTRVEGVGPEAIRCAVCGAEVNPFRVTNGYTIVFDEARQVGVTVGPEVAERLARDAAKVMALPKGSEQNPIVALCPADIPGVATRLRPFIGNIGTTPSIDMPDSHNAGDFGQFLVDAPHEYGITKEQLEEARTDGHMDIDSVREGAVLICPVKVAGGGVYVGDVHAMQGDGEIAGHTTDVSAEVTLQVSLLKGLKIGGPILLPPVEDLPYLARPLTGAEREAARRLAETFGQSVLEEAAPIQMVGSGANLNEATDNGVARLAELLGMSKEEVLNRVTLTGGVEIGRLPGVVTVTMMAPLARLEEVGLADLVRSQYGL
ncbi:MAG TPA: acetamidase/formamidase family protein [Thermoflexia bacterium]|nr:acetamidase/formamidase family protein [Thermoflexia bacterium]